MSQQIFQRLETLQSATHWNTQCWIRTVWIAVLVQNKNLILDASCPESVREVYLDWVHGPVRVG